jgi:tRNA uridine 5-carboxymethylaminomethyl modification enzyme
MFTSRAEYRLSLREDNADLRLTEKGRMLGLVGADRWGFFERKRGAVDAEIARLGALLVRPGEEGAALLAKLGAPLARESMALDLLRRPGLEYEDIAGLAPDAGPDADWRGDERLAPQVRAQVDVQAKYAGYLKRQEAEIDRSLRNERLRLPADLDYTAVRGLSNEARARLIEVRPSTLGQAARIPGLTPAAVSLLLVHMKKRDCAA